MKTKATTLGLRESLKFARNILILEHIFKEMFIIDGFEPIKYPIIVFITVIIVHIWINQSEFLIHIFSSNSYVFRRGGVGIHFQTS